jgi:GxxExxY protein
MPLRAANANNVDDQRDLLVYRVLDAAHVVHNTLGPGFIESIYSKALALELRRREFHVDRERTIKVWYGPSLVGKHRFDLIVNHIVIIELKASRCIAPIHILQMRSYLHASSLAFGILLNFGTTELQWEVVTESSETSNLY